MRSVADTLRALTRRRDPQVPPRVYFLHIPKCGGTSIKRALAQAYPAESRAHLDSGASRKAAEAVGMDLDVFRVHLLAYHMAAGKTRFIAGHFGWSDDAMRAQGDRWQVVTILRDPVARWYSHFFYNAYHGGEHFQITEDLETFLDSDRARHYGRLQVAHLADPSVPPEEAVAAAKRSLDRCSVVGLLEDLDRFVAQYRAQFGVQLQIGHHRSSPAASRKSEAMKDPAIQEKIRALCAPDLELYEYARQRIHA